MALALRGDTRHAVARCPTGDGMRLTCPNCKAQYEVDGRVVPPGGRDVQCSACGTTWFQYPDDVALRMRAADLDDDDDDDNAAPGAAPAAAPAEQRIDKTVLDVLRAEAEREMGERRQARPPVETQPDLGLVSRPRPRGEARPAPLTEAGTASRRARLPADIDQLSSTLESAGATRASQAEAAPPSEEPVVDAGRGFRRGLAYVLVAGGVFVALYLFAPTLADWVPALAGPLSGYVAMVDALRLAVARLLGA